MKIKVWVEVSGLDRDGTRVIDVPDGEVPGGGRPNNPWMEEYLKEEIDRMVSWGWEVVEEPAEAPQRRPRGKRQ